jgi:large subunit ribosomal protein L32
LSVCPQCHEPKLPHFVCPSCGTYRGRKVVVKEEE